MPDSALIKTLIEGLEQMQIIDAHEHLSPESVRTGSDVDVFTLFSHYTKYDLLLAGMTQQQYNDLENAAIPLETRWKSFEPFLERIRYTSYTRAALLAAKKFYGADDINAGTYQHITKAIKEANRPGLYDKVLREACKIKTCLTQIGSTDLGSDLLTPVMPMPILYDVDTAESLLNPFFEPTASVRSVDDYLDAARRYVLRVKSEGAVGLKVVSNPFGEPNRSEAISVFDGITSGRIKVKVPEWPMYAKPTALKDYILDESIKFAGEQDLTVAVHAGYWGDFRDLHPAHMIPIIERHPNVRFDVYHLGYPYVRETLMLAKGFPNVWLNLCWTHVLSQKCAIEGLDEAIDLVPVNKIIGFGADYIRPVEKVYGQLVMARENIATVLARRVERGQMDEDKALHIARMWLWDNPRELYHLDSRASSGS